jgi:hypothetical protein
VVSRFGNPPGGKRAEGLGLEATVTFNDLGREVMPEGPWNGMMPSFGFAGSLVACRVHSRDGASHFPFGVPVKVFIETVVTLDPYRRMATGDGFSLDFGGLVIASGRVDTVTHY